MALKIAAVIARLAPDEKPLRSFLSAKSETAQLAGGIKQGLLVNHLHFGQLAPDDAGLGTDQCALKCIECSGVGFRDRGPSLNVHLTHHHQLDH
ncbi:hypothetical protein ALP29_201413 [Pseudomonas syringae pv. avii]|uniref:Uncharacterized protein n=1 Tax=Pseudomonas syringae pv. avii TaxID=663959 RepID=A0A3M5UKN6_PSESX|nr:hypothetical protein ALP29_201413 [Pseudomonas syringae pv. avii]